MDRRRKSTPYGQRAIELCKQFPKASTKALAKMLYDEFEDHYKDVEAARGAIRYYRDELSKSTTRVKCKDENKVTRRERTKSKSNDPEILLPRSYAHKKEPFKLPKSSKKVLILSDIHIPYQDNDAIKAAVKYGQDNEVDTIYLNGDILDFYQVSFHEKDMRKRPTMAEEVEAAMEFFTWLRKEFPTEQIYYIPGNHENRLERYLINKAPALLGIDEFQLKIILRLEEFKIHYLEHKSKVYFGKLLVEHGDKMRGTGGVNPARTLLLKFKRSVLCGHFHRTSQANSKVYDGDFHMAWSTGMLCEDEPDYLDVNEHNCGAAIVEIKDNGNFKVNNFQIQNGEVY